MLAVLKILADETRLRLLYVLSHGTFTVQELVLVLGVGQSLISHHLKLLTNSGLLQLDKQGTWHYYHFAPSDKLFQQLWPAIQGSLKSLKQHQLDLTAVCRVMAERRQRSLEFFQKHAQDWDQIHAKELTLPDYQQVLIDRVQKGAHVVEIGFGTGKLLPLLAEKCAHVVGIDNAPAMIEAGRKMIEKMSLLNTEVRLAEMAHLPIRDKSVDSVILNQVLHHAEAPPVVLKEIARTLKVEGRLLVADLLRHDNDWVRQNLADQWLGFSREELSLWLRDSGFAIEEYFLPADRVTPKRVFLLIAVRKET